MTAANKLDRNRGKLSLALARVAYAEGRFRLANADLAGFSHLVSTRNGLFAVNEEGYALVAHGLFFGITPRGDDIFLFEACDLPRAGANFGRLVQLTRKGAQLVATEIRAEALDNGCHQIDFIGDRLCVLDTYRQEALLFDEDFGSFERLSPLGEASSGEWANGYAHMNAVLEVGDSVLLLLHNGGAQSGKNSEIAVFDSDWVEKDRWPLAGQGCHDLAVLDDGTVLSCGSMAGELIGTEGFRMKIGDAMTRGLSVGADSIVVGSSVFSTREGRHLTSGTVTFLDRDYATRAVVALPGAPTAIRRLDGADLTLSRHVNQRKFLLRPPPARGFVEETRR